MPQKAQTAFQLQGGKGANQNKAFSNRIINCFALKVQRNLPAGNTTLLWKEQRKEGIRNFFSTKSGFSNCKAQFAK